MLFEFRSRAAGTVIMTDAVGRQMLQALGREPEPRGVLTAAQLPQAIESLRAAVAAERAEIERSQASATPARSAHDAQTEPAAIVSFAQRAQPLIEMLERSAAAGRDVTWGV